jgi:LacI family transcriptional regulator
MVSNRKVSCKRSHFKAMIDGRNTELDQKRTSNKTNLGRDITIFDVADEAGVSYSTVSRVVNNKGSVSPDKRERVLRAMTQLG